MMLSIGYGTATALGYQAQAYPSNGFQNHGFPLNSYPVAAHSFPTSFAVPSTGYGGISTGTGYGVYGGSGHGFTAKRAVSQDSSKVNNQNTNNLGEYAARVFEFDKKRM